MKMWFPFVWMLSSACGDSEEASLSPAVMVVEVPSEGVEKDIQQGGLSVRTLVAPNSIRLGDAFQLELTVEGDSDVEIEMPPFGEALGRLTIVDFTPKQSVTEKDGQQVQVHVQKYGLQANRSGEVVIPALRIGYRLNVDTEWEEILTEQIPVTVASILPTDGDLVYQNSRARLSPLPVAQPWIPWTIGGVAIGVLVAFGLWFVSRRERVGVQTSAYQQAMQTMIRLQDDIALLTDEDSVDAVYAGLSTVLRAFLEGCFTVSTLEQTTEELRESLGTDLAVHHPVVLEEHITDIIGVLSLCDGVKFAGKGRTLLEVQSDWNTVQNLVNTIHERSMVAIDNRLTEEAQDGLVQT